MERQEIIKLLKENHSSFINYINDLMPEEFLLSTQQKWTAGQQLNHIYLSVKPFSLALSMPKFFLRLIFGKANRPGRTYEDLVDKYLVKLKNGGKAPTQFIPKSVVLNQKGKIIIALNKSTYSLCSKIERFSDKELDNIILPHPLLGKLTIREMLCFTIYHVKHHHELTKLNLSRSI